MKFLFIVQGEGRGHFTQAIKVHHVLYPVSLTEVFRHP